MNFLEVAAERLRENMPDAVIVEGPMSSKIEGTGTHAISLLYGGSWTTKRGSRSLHPVLVVNIFADVSRDPSGFPIQDDAEDRAWQAWEQADALLNDVEHEWREVLSSYRRFEPEVTEVPGGDGAILLTAKYEVQW